MKFLQLEKNAKKPMENFTERATLAILGDCATQHLATAIKGYAAEKNLALTVFDADYNQIDAQVMDKDSQLYQSQADYVLFYLCAEHLTEEFYACAQGNRHRFAEEKMAQIESYWALVKKNMRTHILQFNFVQEDDGVFGNFANKTQESFLYQVRKLNFLLMEKCQELEDVFVVDLDAVARAFPPLRDEKMYYLAKMPISLQALPEVAKQVTDVILATRGKIKKCIITDLDNTLWGGVVGDDGWENIQIGDLGLGGAFTEFQRYLKELKNRGILLAVCSKNEEQTAKEPFLKHPDMVLSLEDFSVFLANWEDKATNICRIQETLNIGMDSIVFLDDSPFERESVRRMLPEVTVVDLPEDPAQYLTVLKSLNLFETASYAEEDKVRTRQYREEAKRTKLRQNFADYGEYLKSLEMKAKAEPFDSFSCARIAQLTQRSNQFNLRTIRYTQEQIRQIMEDDTHFTLYFTLQDKLGDYGLIAVVILDKQENNTLFISEWLMSCRVLKRGMEEFIADTVIALAKQNGYHRVVGEYIPTAKNLMVSDLYEKLGFTRTEDGLYAVNVKDYTPHKTAIAKE